MGGELVAEVVLPSGAVVRVYDARALTSVLRFLARSADAAVPEELLELDGDFWDWVEERARKWGVDMLHSVYRAYAGGLLTFEQARQYAQAVRELRHIVEDAVKTLRAGERPPRRPAPAPPPAVHTPSAQPWDAPVEAPGAPGAEVGAPEGGARLPSFAEGNPWLEILSKRGS